MTKSKQNMKKNNNKTIKKRYRRKLKNKRKKTKRRQTKRKQTTKKLLKGGEELLYTFRNIYKNLVEKENEEYKYFKLQKKEGPPLREWLKCDILEEAGGSGNKHFVISTFVETRKNPTFIKWTDFDVCIIPDINIENITTDDDYMCNTFNLNDYNVKIEYDTAIRGTLDKCLDTRKEESVLITFTDIIADSKNEKYFEIEPPEEGMKSLVKIIKEENNEKLFTIQYVYTYDEDNHSTYDAAHSTKCIIDQRSEDRYCYDEHDHDADAVSQFDTFSIINEVTDDTIRGKIDESIIGFMRYMRSN